MKKLSDLAPHYAGHLFGTNTGRIHLALYDHVEGASERMGLLRVSDDHLGVSGYEVSISLNGELIGIAGQPSDHIEGVEQGEIEATGSFDARGNLRGEWRSTVGTGGTFDLYPHLGSQAVASASTPEQFYTSSRDLGALRLYRSDLTEILSVLRRKFPISRIIISHLDRGAELALFDDQFEARIPTLEKLDWIKLFVQGPMESGLTRSLTIDLGQSFNRVTAQGPDESWVLGEVEATASSLRRRQQRFSTAIGKHKVNFNLLIFLAALVAMPELQFRDRAFFMLGVVLLIAAANKAKDTLVPNFRMDVGSDRPNIVAQVWPSALSWMISVTSAVAASFLFSWLNS